MPATRKAVPGDTQIEKRLWNTYLYWARAAVAPEIDPTLEISKAANGLPTARAQAPQAIVFSAFVLEFRLKLVYDYLGIAFRKRDTSDHCCSTSGLDWSKHHGLTQVALFRSLSNGDWSNGDSEP
jgi:hypothetical protein